MADREFEPTAIIALTISLVGLIVPFGSIAAIILAIIALNKIKKRNRRGKELAIIAIVLSALWMLLSVFLMGLVIFF